MNRLRPAAARAALLSLLMILPAVKAAAAPEFELGLAAESATFLSGAPIRLEATFINHGKNPASVNFRDDGREALAFSVRDAAGKEVAAGDFFKPRVAGYPPLDIPAGVTEKRPAYLNRWLSTLLPAGMYEVRGRVRWFAGDTKNPREALTAIKITILPADPAQAAAQLEGLREIAQGEPLAGGITAAVPVKQPAADPALAARRDARTRIAMADFPDAAAYRSLILCACMECGGVDFDDVTTRIKSRPEPADVQMLIDVVRQGQCAGAGRNAARRALSELYIGTNDQALKRVIRPALDVRVPK